MSVFHDKTYEGMDWLSKAIEPYSSPLNDILREMPDELEVSANDLGQLIGNSYSNEVSVANIIVYNDLVLDLTWAERDLLCESYELDTSDFVSVNLDSMTMEGSVRLVKVRHVLDDKDIKRVMAQDRISLNASSVSTEAVSDLGRLLFEDKTHEFYSLTTKSARLYCILQHVNSSAENDTFKIRSHTANSTFIKMVGHYLQHNDGPSLGKLYRVITMAKSGIVSYTVE